MSTRKWWYPSIRKQMVAGVALAHTLLILTLIPAIVNRQKAFLLDRSRDRALSQADLLAASSVPQLLTNDMAGLSNLLTSIARDKTIRFAMVTDKAGRVLAHTDSRHIREWLTDARSRNQLQSAKRAVVSESGEFVETAAPVVLDQDVLGWSWVAADRRADNAQIDAVVHAGVRYSAIALACGVLVAVWIGTTLTRPLRLLVAGARRLAAGDLETPVPVVTRTEAGTLAEAFNKAMDQLAAHRREVERSQAELRAEIAERTRAEQELQAANAAILSANEHLREFAYAASHDLQEPLRAIVSFSGILVKRYRDSFDEQAAELLDFVHDGGVRMQKLIQGLLEYSRAGGDDAAPAKVAAGTALAAALDNLRAAIDASGAEVGHGDLPSVKVHEVALIQLFQNLVGNAIKYASGKPIIRIAAERRGIFWRFGVADNGIGLEPRDYRRVFRIFTRVHGDQYPGTGVGLAICSKIVERYGGKIWVESELGKGSTFYFTLPAAS